MKEPILNRILACINNNYKDGKFMNCDAASALEDLFKRIKEEDRQVENREMIESALKYITRTKEDSWCKDVVKTKDGKSCIIGHVFDMGGNKAMDWFESSVATSYMIYPVNDGTHPDYPQPTPKERCIAYLEDVLSGKQKTSAQLWDEAG